MTLKLSTEGFIKAREFIFRQGSELDQALFDYHFDQKEENIVISALERYKNSDGGYGNALEPDTFLPDSSVIATTIAFQILRQLNMDSSNPFVWDSIQYLINNFNQEQYSWLNVPPEVENYPHAPWWRYNNDYTTTLANPRAEILGIFFDYKKLVPDELLQTLLAEVLDFLQPGIDTLEIHDLLCYTRLLKSKGLPEENHQYLLEKLTPHVQKAVAKTPTEWLAYGLKPLQVAGTPKDEFAGLLSESINRQLDFEITQQDSDGAWKPNWNWGNFYRNEWPNAERLWKSRLTLNNLLYLKAYNRLEI